MSVNKDMMPIEEIVYGGDEWGVGEAKAKVKGVAEERGTDGGSIVIIYISSGAAFDGGARPAMEQMARAGALKRFD